MRAVLVLAVALLGTARAGWAADLFACRVIVTGTDMRSRPAGLERCVAEVVVKLTGRPDAAAYPRVQGLIAQAPELVEDLAYVDRMSDVPHHDEQGSRDRPYDLLVHLDPERLTAGLTAAGLRPWLHRPALLVRVGVQRDGAPFTLTADGDAGERQREALLAAAERFGMRVVLPTEAQIGSGSVPLVTGRTATLTGSLIWSEADFGWNAEWRLGSGAPWSVRGVSFDEAFRAGILGAAERLSRE